MGALVLGLLALDLIMLLKVFADVSPIIAALISNILKFPDIDANIISLQEGHDRIISSVLLSQVQKIS